MQAWTIGVLSQRLDYLRILSARGYDVNESEIEGLRKEIAEERTLLERLRKGEA